MSRRQLELYRTSVVVPGGKPGQNPFRLSILDLGAEHKDTAPTAVFLHGAGGSMVQWHNQLTLFQQRMRVVAMDMRGHGMSEYPASSTFEIDEFVLDVAHLVEALKIDKPFFLLGHSWGGAVAAAFASQYSDQLRGLALVATSGKIHLHPTTDYVMKLPAFLLKPLQQTVNNSITSPPDVLKKLVPYVRRWRGWDLYPQITAPTLGIAGELDWLTRPASMQDMINHIPGGWLERVSFAGHLPHLERPKRVNKILETFLFPEKKVNWRGQSG